MLSLSLWVPVLIAGATGLGALGLVGARLSPCPVRAGRARRLFLAVVLAVGALGVVAAGWAQRGVVPAGLVLGGLLIAMLWGGAPAAKPAPAE